MHAFIIVGGSHDARLGEIERKISEWHILPLDIVELGATDEHIGIFDVREFQKRLLLAPLQSPYTVGTISDANLLTTEAQQALLKLLEEPPPHAYIVLETQAVDELLPTIISRAHVIRLADEEVQVSPDAANVIKKLLAGDPSSIFTEVDMHATDRIQAKLWAQELLITSRVMLLTEHSKNMAGLVRRIQKAQAQLSANCNPKLVLDQIFLLH